MSSNYLTNPIHFLIDVLVNLYISIVILRFLLQWVRADFYNPVSQTLVKITNPLLLPLRRLIPGWGGLDIASIFLIFILTAAKLIILGSISKYIIIYQYQIPVPTLQLVPIILCSLADVINTFLNLYLFTIFVQIILSWVAPNQYNPFAALLYQINTPLLKPARRLLPPISGIDFSAMITILLIWVSKMLLIPPILMFAT